MFVDAVTITLHAGDGGNGVIAWRREKFIPKGGPTGGNGGQGGSVYLKANPHLYSLDLFRHRKVLNAENGMQGGANCRTGRDGKDLVLELPCGTLVKDAASGDLLHDLTEEGKLWCLCRGGKGGKGNAHFKSPTHQAPYVCTPGEKGEIKEIEFDLKLIADVGLIGMPNAGKSTLLSRLAKVNLKTGAYPFTTLSPNICVVRPEEGIPKEIENLGIGQGGSTIFSSCTRDSVREHGPSAGRKKRGKANAVQNQVFSFLGYKPLLVADIPGLIQGAHRNKGLGIAFLKHVERCALLVYVIDLSGQEERDPYEDFVLLREELRAYHENLLDKPFVIALNKIDQEEAQAHLTRFIERCPWAQDAIAPISASRGDGLQHLVQKMARTGIEPATQGFSVLCSTD